MPSGCRAVITCSRYVASYESPSLKKIPTPACWLAIVLLRIISHINARPKGGTCYFSLRHGPLCETNNTADWPAGTYVQCLWIECFSVVVGVAAGFTYPWRPSPIHYRYDCRYLLLVLLPYSYVSWPCGLTGEKWYMEGENIKCLTPTHPFLWRKSNRLGLWWSLHTSIYIILYVLCTHLHGSVADLKAYLRRWK